MKRVAIVHISTLARWNYDFEEEALRLDLWEKDSVDREESQVRSKRMERLHRIREANKYIDEMFERNTLVVLLEVDVLQKIRTLESCLQRGKLLQFRARVPRRLIQRAHNENQRESSRIEDFESSASSVENHKVQKETNCRRSNFTKTYYGRR